MMRITRDKITYKFSPDEKPVAAVQPGEIVEFHTHDCFTGQLQSEEDLISVVDFDRINPATGPVAVDGAKPGDLLVVEIQDIELGTEGFMVTIPGGGAFGKRFSTPTTKLVRVKEGKFHFNRSLSFPIRPMVGVIGVAPVEGSVSCGEIGDHGGNMDCTAITAGARLYFLVRHDGALFGLGDVHAGMGDGEAVICGVEIPAVVRVKFGLVSSPEQAPLRPVVELGDRFITIGHGPSLDAAAQQALDDMLELVMQRTNLQVAEAAMLISAVGDLKVCQIVDPQKTARVEMPRSILPVPEIPLWGHFFKK